MGFKEKARNIFFGINCFLEGYSKRDVTEAMDILNSGTWTKEFELRYLKRRRNREAVVFGATTFPRPLFPGGVEEFDNYGLNPKSYRERIQDINNFPSLPEEQKKKLILDDAKQVLANVGKIKRDQPSDFNPSHSPAK